MTTEKKPKSTARNGGRFGPGNPGRPPGPNKMTQEFRETVKRLLEDNSTNVGKWLTAVAEGDPVNEIKPDPAKALDLLAKLAEFAAPKLNRTEHVGDGGGPVLTAAVMTDAQLMAIAAGKKP